MSADKEVQLHFKAYYHQSEAMDVYIKDKSNLRIFSYENPTSKCQGSRKYIATDLSEFVKWYLNTKEEIRNFYEIIPIDTPCRLYFDLEYPKEQNPDTDSREVFDKFCLTVKDLLKSEYNIEVDIDKSFLILESSTPTKFSLHVIVHLPEKQLFSSNVEMKKFTDFLYITMLEKDIALVYNGKVNNVGEKIKVPIFDPAVYTKNRNFRLYLSCKLGKNVHLKLADWCKFYQCKNVLKPVDVQIFFDSLCVPRFYDKCQILPEYNVDVEVVKEKIPKAKATGRAVLNNVCKANNDYCEFLKNGYGRTSPFASLEKFIVGKSKEYVSTADIRAWDLINVKKTGKIKIIFHIKGSRYCFHIGREHKSNHVYWETYFDPDLICCQKCFDRECHGKVSLGFKIPKDVTEDVISTLKEMDLYRKPNDSFSDSFHNAARDNVTLIDDEEIITILDTDENKQSRKRNSTGILDSPAYKIPRLPDINKEIKKTIGTQTNNEFIVVDGRIPTQNNDIFEVTGHNKESFSIDAPDSRLKTHEIIIDEDEFMTDDDSNSRLSIVSYYTASEPDPLNDCFINSTLSSLNESSILNSSTRLNPNQRNICIADSSGVIQTILETSYDTTDNDNSPKTTNKNIDNEESYKTPIKKYTYRSPRTLEEAEFIRKKCASSEKCKTPFKSPVVNKRRDTTKYGRKSNRKSLRKPLVFEPLKR
uniref:DNA-directed primase/polymerase protein n=1 Tax=Strongyloides papillosus TaxID=174720 RepID=A0A0N5B286_STREA